MFSDLATNPLLKPSPLPLGFPQFDKIQSEHFRPALEVAMAEHNAEIAAIAEGPVSEATFENVLVALEKAGQTLARVNGIFQHLNHAATDDVLQAIDTEFSPKLTAHMDTIMMNPKLFQKIDALYTANKRDEKLDTESSRLLWRYHTDFVRAGAQLDGPAMEQLKKLNGDLATLETKFQQAVLAEVADSAVWINTEAELEGFSAEELTAAKEAATNFVEKDGKKKKEGAQFLVKLKNTTQQPVLVQLKNPETRKTILAASMARGSRGTEHDSRETVCCIARKRAERAKLLGYANHAAFVLEDEMVGTPEKALALLAKLAAPALANAKKEAQELRDMSGLGDKFCAADWDHYAEQLRSQKYGFDSDQLKPYLELHRVVNDGLFYAATQLYGITFTERTDLPVYHETIKVYDVKEENGDQIGIFFTDFYSRDNKMGGAWMSATVGQSGLLGTLPVIDNHSNVPPPAAGKPTLIDLDHLTTAFHEAGHGLHGLLSKVKFPKFAGTAVSRDAVECPSQLNETWALHPQVAPHYLKHYETGEPLDPKVIDQVRAAAKFNQGYATTEYLAACFLDIAMHLFSDPDQVPTAEQLGAWEKATLQKYNVYDEVVPTRYRCTYFMHSFGGGYSAAYNSYVGSEVLDADCETWFKENGGLTRKNGDHFRSSVLCRGNSLDFNDQIKTFLGREPRIEPLLERRGLN